MNEFEVTCINKQNRSSSHEHITYIGNISGNWRISREDAIRRITSNSEMFYTIDQTTSRKVYIGVVPGEGARAPYLRTHADGKWNDNLLSLPECSGTCKILG